MLDILLYDRFKTYFFQTTVIIFLQLLSPPPLNTFAYTFRACPRLKNNIHTLIICVWSFHGKYVGLVL